MSLTLPVLSKRLIAVILLRDGRAVKSKQFGAYRDVGNPVSQARIYYANGIDELVILNTQGEKGISPLLDTLCEVSEQCFIPIAAGGGVQSVDDAATIIKCGAEKVVVRSAVQAIPAIVERFGRQSVVECRDYHGGLASGPAIGGEVLYQSVERDGMMDGYDLAPIESDVPVIRLGGCGNYQHLLDAFKAGADACAAGSLFAFTDSNPMRAKAFLRNNGINMRTK
jgi:cyclase